MQALAVSIRDVTTFGVDKFYVQVGPDEVRVYEAHVNGTVKELTEQPLPLVAVTAAIEKWNDAYRIDRPISLGRPEDLVPLLGKFEPTSETSCRYTG